MVFAWQLTGEWKYDPDFVTEVEVRFIKEGSGTRVELEHRNLDRYGTAAETVRASLDSPDGWAGGLRLFATAVEETG